MEHFSGTTATIGLMPARLLLTPATATWTLPFGAYLLFLSARIVSLRVKHNTLLGDHIQTGPHTRGKTEIGKTEFGSGLGKTELGKTEFGGGMNKTELGKGMGKTEIGSSKGRKVNAGSENPDDPDPLFLATRCLTNYLETVPMAMIFSLLAELNGGNRRVLNYALGALFLAKVAHIELGLLCAGTKGVGRPVGYYGGQSWMAGMASYCAYLVKDYWWV